MTQTDNSTSPSFLLRWAGILLFIGTPWILILLLMPVPDLPDEFNEKMEAFHQRTHIDTIVIGDSRVMRIHEDEFKSYGWTFFNMGQSGLSPEDAAMSLHFALANRPIRRVVIGLSFENMTESFPFEFSRYRSRYVNESTSSTESTRLFVEPTAEANSQDVKIIEKVKHLIENAQFQELIDKIVGRLRYLISSASDQLHMLLSILGIRPLPPILLPNGNVAYIRVQEDMQSRPNDFRPDRHDGSIEQYWNRVDSEARYLARGTLSESAKDVYRNIFSTLKQRGIPAVAFETVKFPAYQQRIDSDPLLHLLQNEWRGFYRDQQSTCLRFLDFAMLEGVYDPNDFFDATHFIGPTEHRLAAKIASELSTIGGGCVPTVVGPSVTAAGK